MKKLILILTSIVLVVASCSKDKKDKEEELPKQNIQSTTFNETLKTYTPKVGDERFEYTYYIDYDVIPLNLYCSLGFLMSWEQIPNGYYMYFNNGVGRIIVNDNGMVKAFDAGATIENNKVNNWDATGALAYDYVLDSSSDKGELAGKGDKYIGIKIWDQNKEEDECYFGWLKVNVSANGRDVKVLEQGINLEMGKSLKTGEK